MQEQPTKLIFPKSRSHIACHRNRDCLVSSKCESAICSQTITTPELITDQPAAFGTLPPAMPGRQLGPHEFRFAVAMPGQRSRPPGIAAKPGHSDRSAAVRDRAAGDAGWECPVARADQNSGDVARCHRSDSTAPAFRGRRVGRRRVATRGGVLSAATGSPSACTGGRGDDPSKPPSQRHALTRLLIDRTRVSTI